MTDDFMGGGFKTFPFDNPGDTLSGTITELPVKEQQRDMNTGEPKTWGDGRPQWMFRVTLQTDLRDPSDIADDGIRTLYLSWKRLDAVRNAIRAAGATNIEVGGKLALRFDSFGPVTKKGFSAPKVGWTAWYKPPEATPAFMDTEPAPSESRPTAYEPDAARSTLDNLAAMRQARQNQSETMEQIRSMAARPASDFPAGSSSVTPPHHSTEDPPF